MRFWLGWAQQVAGDYSAARKVGGRQAANWKPLLKEQPENFVLIGHLALINMGLVAKPRLWLWHNGP